MFAKGRSGRVSTKKGSASSKTWTDQTAMSVSDDAFSDPLMKQNGYIKVKRQKKITINSVLKSLNKALEENEDNVKYKNIKSDILETFSEKMVNNIVEEEKTLGALKGKIKNIINSFKSKRKKGRVFESTHRRVTRNKFFSFSGHF